MSLGPGLPPPNSQPSAHKEGQSLALGTLSRMALVMCNMGIWERVGLALRCEPLEIINSFLAMGLDFRFA